MGQGNFPLDDLTYDMVTLLYEKSKGLQAYDKYLQDAQGSPPCTQLLQQLRQQDEDAVRQLQDHVKQLLNGTMGSGSQGGMQGQGSTGSFMDSLNTGSGSLDRSVGGSSLGSASTMGTSDVDTVRGLGTSDTDLGSTRSSM
jgi:hypothetical protein